MVKTLPSCRVHGAVLTHGKGFYSPLVYALECYRLGLTFIAPCVNHPCSSFEAEGSKIRVPVISIKGLSQDTIDRFESEGKAKRFSSL